MAFHDLNAIQSYIPHCLSLAVLDIERGTVLGMVSEMDEALDGNLMSAAAGVFFGSDDPEFTQRLLHAGGDSDVEPTDLRDVIVRSGDLLHVFCRSLRDPARILLCVCRAEAGLGRILAGSRIALKELQELA